MAYGASLIKLYLPCPVSHVVVSPCFHLNFSFASLYPKIPGDINLLFSYIYTQICTNIYIYPLSTTWLSVVWNCSYSLPIQEISLSNLNESFLGGPVVTICLPMRRHRRCEFDLWWEKIPWSRKWQPSPVYLPGTFLGQSSQMDYSP